MALALLTLSPTRAFENEVENEVVEKEVVEKEVGMRGMGMGLTDTFIKSSRHLQGLLPAEVASGEASSEGLLFYTSTVVVTGGSFASEIGWELVCEGSDASIVGWAPYEAVHSVSTGTCTLTMTDSYGDGWNGYECAPLLDDSSTQHWFHNHDAAALISSAPTSAHPPVRRACPLSRAVPCT